MENNEENEIFEDKMITEIQKRPLLYDVKSKSFSDFMAKENLWKEVEGELGVPAEILKKKWETIRDYYRRNKDKPLTGPAAKRKGAFHLQRLERLKRFLDNAPSTKRSPRLILPKQDVLNVNKESEGIQQIGTSWKTDNLVIENISSDVVFNDSSADKTKNNMILQIEKQDRAELNENDLAMDKFFDFIKAAARNLTPMQQLGLKQSISEMLFAYESENIRNDCV